MKKLAIALGILMGINIMAQELKLETKWDKTFPKSENRVRTRRAFGGC